MKEEDSRLLIANRLEKLLNKIKENKNKAIIQSKKRKIIEDMYYVLGMWAAFCPVDQFVSIVKDLEAKYG